MSKCKDCGETLPSDATHRDEHPELCCDCFDVDCGKPIELVNQQRAERTPPMPPLVGKR